MGKIKEDLRLIDYLKEKGISHEQLKTMIEESVNTALEKDEGTEEVEQTEESGSEPEKEEVPQFTIAQLKEMIQEQVQDSLKIKRKVPSKGKIVKPEDIPKDKDIIKKNWFEVMV